MQKFTIRRKKLKKSERNSSLWIIQLLNFLLLN